MTKFRTRTSNSGYDQFSTDGGRSWTYSHRRVAEKRIGGEIPSGMVVHHVNREKSDNRWRNLIPVDRAIHGRIHAVEDHGGGDVCFRCGRIGHWASDCYAGSDFKGREIDHPFDSRR